MFSAYALQRAANQQNRWRLHSRRMLELTERRPVSMLPGRSRARDNYAWSFRRHARRKELAGESAEFISRHVDDERHVFANQTVPIVLVLALVFQRVMAAHNQNARAFPAIRKRSSKRCRSGKSRRHSRNNLERHVCCFQRLELLAEAAEDRGITAFQPYDVHAAPCGRDHQVVDFALRDLLSAAALADVQDNRSGVGESY